MKIIKLTCSIFMSTNNLKIQQRLIFAIAIHCYRPQLWEGHCIYFKITDAFCSWMFFNLTKEINKLR